MKYSLQFFFFWIIFKKNSEIDPAVFKRANQQTGDQFLFLDQIDLNLNFYTKKKISLLLNIKKIFNYLNYIQSPNNKSKEIQITHSKTTQRHRWGGPPPRWGWEGGGVVHRGLCKHHVYETAVGTRLHALQLFFQHCIPVLLQESPTLVFYVVREMLYNERCGGNSIVNI